jgi:P27 family predicted phage terminase small subunit
MATFWRVSRACAREQMKRGRKSLEELTVVPMSDQRPVAPPSLSDDQREEWDSIVNSLPADYFRPGDTPLLAAFCTASVFYRKAAEDISVRGISLMDDKGREYANPSHQLLTSQASAMAQMAVKLRLCPSARMTGKGAQSKSGDSAKGVRPWGDLKSA